MDEKSIELQACQIAAIRYVYDVSNDAVLAVRAGANENSLGDNYFEREYNRIAQLIDGNFPIDVQFHPDRLAKNGSTVIDELLATMTYENQYVSGISNGLLDTSAGSSRRRWETRLFGSAYDNQPDSLRPKYGAINLFNSSEGACPRFGSCFLRLNSHIHSRCTLSYGDSHIEPKNIGTSNSLNLILNALYEDYLSHDGAEGKGISLRSVSRRLEKSRKDKEGKNIGRILDDIIEIHVHGNIRIDRDVDFISVDSSFKNTEIGKIFIELKARAKVNIIWRPGFRLRINQVPPNFRGENLIKFMKHCWQDGHVDAYRLGRKANEIICDPHKWTEWGGLYDVLQLVKQTWHSIVVFGEPVEIDK